MKNRNQSTLPTYHSNTSNSNNTNNISYNNNNNNSNSYNQFNYAQQEQNQFFNHNQRQHSNRNRCQIITPQQVLLPTQNQQHNTKINPTNFQQYSTVTTTTTTATTMSSLATTNFLQNQFANPQHFAPYLNQQHQQQQTYQQQQQYTNINRNQLMQQQQQHMLQQQQQNHNQQQSELQFQRRQQLQLPLFSQNNAMQQFQQQQPRRQLFEQQQIGNATVNNVNNNNNNNNQNNNSNATTSNGNDNEKFNMDATEIANFLANELFMQQFVSVDGIQSGVPTLTTSTLTPTLLKSVEETFIQLIEEPTQAPAFQAGFIPPTYPSTSSNTSNNISDTFNGSVHEFIETESEDSRNSLDRPIYEDYALGGETTENSSATTDSTSFQNGLHKSSFATSNSNSASTNDFSAINVAIAAAAGKKTNNTSPSATTSTGTTRRNQGGRRPAKPSNLSPEEEEKRRIRRERNKLAAARCRKRRVDLTNDLLEEVSLLEKKRDGLQKDIATLNTQKQELEYILEAHRPNCQKIIKDLMSVTTFNGLIAPNNNATSNDDNSGTITGIDTTLASTGRGSPIELKPVIDNILGIPHIKNEPIDPAIDGNSLDHDGPPSPKRMLLTSNNPMIPPPLPKIGTLSPSLAAASLNTPIVTTAPVSFANFANVQNTNIVVNTLNALNKPLLNLASGAKQRPTTLPTMPRTALGLNIDNNKTTMDINGVAIQTPSTGMFNFDSLMDGGTGLTPVSGPLVPTCSSQNKHPSELITPTSEPSKLVSL